MNMLMKQLVRSVPAQIASVLILSLLLWASGLPGWMHTANAAALSNVSDTLYDSDLSAASRHIINFTTQSAVAAGETIVIHLDPDTSAFSQIASAATTTDIQTTGMTLVAACGGGGDEVTVVGNYNNGTDENLTFTVCAGDTVSAGAKTVTVGSIATPLWTNPSGAGSYRIVIDGTMDDAGETRIYIIDDVVVTASVDSVFTFTIDGRPAGSTVNGSPTTTATSTTSTLIPFGTLVPGTSKTLAQRIYVTTNAANGYSVTIRQDQNLSSAVGADIDLFIDGATTSAPTAWVAPTNVFNQENTYGHFGITSTDDETSSTTNPTEWGSDLWAGNFDAPREVLYHDDPSSGLSASEGEGWADVGFQIEIGTLQEAGNDYTNTLTYVATPIY